MSSLKKLIVKLLRETVDKIDTDNTELTEEEAIEIMSVLAHRAMSKEQACIYMNMSRSKFDDLVREGKLPSNEDV